MALGGYELWQTGTQVLVYDRDGTTPRNGGDPLDAVGVTWSDALKSDGGAQYTVPWVQAALASDPDLLRDAVCKVAVRDSPGGALTERFAWLSYPGSGQLVQEGGPAAKQETPACRGIRALVDDWLVLMDGGFQSFGGSTRNFGWMSSTYDSSGWSTPLGRAWSADTNPSRAGFPEVFATLDPSAQWISLTDPSTATIADGTIYYYVGVYDNPTARLLRIYFAADNYGDLYVNAEPVSLADDAADAYGWQQVVDPPPQKFYDAGPVRFAVAVRNAALTFGQNPCAMILSVVTLDANGNPDEVVFHSDPTTFVVTDQVSGLTAADILLTCTDEAAARGITSASRLTPTFTATTSTAPESATWDDLQERAFEVGTKGSKVLTDLEAEAFDLVVNPDMTVDAFVSRGSDLHASVALTVGVNLTAYAYAGMPLVATRLLARISDQWLYLTDTAAELLYEPREGMFAAELALSVQQGTVTALANLGDLSREDYTYTASLVCTMHPDSLTAVPYVHFGPGDLVNAYDYRMNRATLQVVTLAGSLDARGFVVWTVEMRVP